MEAAENDIKSNGAIGVCMIVAMTSRLVLCGLPTCAGIMMPVIKQT